MAGFVHAQVRNTSVGVRSAYSYGVCFRINSDEKNAAEALLSFRDRGIQFTVLSEKFVPALTRYSDHFILGCGYGGHLGYTRWFSRHEYKDEMISYSNRSSPLLGIDAMLSLEYQFFKMPFITGIDFKPFAELGGKHFFRLNLWDFGFTVKYLLK
jgi:hypothetical protein